MVLLICAAIGVYLVAFIASGHLREAERRINLLQSTLKMYSDETGALRQEIKRRTPPRGPDGKFISKRK